MGDFARLGVEIVAGQSVAQATQAVNNFSQAARNAEQIVGTFKNNAGQFTQSLGGIIVSSRTAAQQLNAFSQGMTKVATAAKPAAEHVQGFYGMVNRFMNMEGPIGGLVRFGVAFQGVQFAAAGIVAPLKLAYEAIKPFIEAAAGVETMRATYGALLGSSASGADMVSYLKNLSVTLPVTMGAMSNGTKTLLGFGFAANEVKDVLPKIAALAMGNSEAFDHLAVVYGQVRAQGKMYMNDLRQFTNAGVPMIEALSEVVKAPQSEIGNMIKNGQIGLTQVREALELITGEGGRFHSTLTAAADTLNGQLTIAANNFKLIFADMGEGSANVVKAFLTDLNVGLSVQRTEKALWDAFLPAGGKATSAQVQNAQAVLEASYGVYDKMKASKDPRDSVNAAVIKVLIDRLRQDIERQGSPADRKDTTDSVFGIWRSDQSDAVAKAQTYTKNADPLTWMKSAGFDMNSRLAQIFMNMGLGSLPIDSETIGFNIDEWLKDNLDPMANSLIGTNYKLSGDRTTPYLQTGPQYQALKAFRELLEEMYGPKKKPKKEDLDPTWGHNAEWWQVTSNNPMWYDPWVESVSHYSTVAIDSATGRPHKNPGFERAGLPSQANVKNASWSDVTGSNANTKDPWGFIQGSDAEIEFLARMQEIGKELENLSKGAYLNSVKALGKAFHDDASRAEAFKNALESTLASTLDAIAPLLLEAGLKACIAGNWVLGLAMIAASGLASFGSGWVSADAAGSSSSNGNSTAKQQLDDMYKYYLAAEAFNREGYKAAAMSGFADGGTFSSSSLRPGVYTSPHFFRFANGGVLGEAGPEAVLPLSRGADGKLGVAGPGVSVVINNYATGTTASADETTGPGGQRMITVTVERIVQDMALKGKIPQPTAGRRVAG